MSSLLSHLPQEEWHTLQTARIRTLKDDVGQSFNQIAQITGIPKSSAHRIYQNSIANQTSRRPKNHSDWKETRGKPPKVI